MKVYTHPHIDMDAASCVALLVVQGHTQLDSVSFVPANTDKHPSHLPMGLYVDHPLGIKGEASALAELEGSRQLLGDMFVDEIAEQDSLGMANPRFSLGQLFAAARVSLRADGLAGEALDRALLEWWLVLVKGLIVQKVQMDEAEKRILVAETADDPQTIPIIIAGGYLWAAPLGPMPPLAGMVLNRKLGVTGFIYEASYGLGIHRFPGWDEPDLRILESELPGWFIHPAGFMACWGSRKAPRQEKPPENTPQTRAELIVLIQRVLDEYPVLKKNAHVIYGWPAPNYPTC